MGAFVLGIAVAAVLAFGTVYGLSIVELSSAKTFSTDAVRL